VAGTIFGVRLDELPSVERLRQVCDAFLDGPGGARIFTPNPEILLRAREDPTFAAILNSADLALPDGTGVAVVESLRRRRRVRRWPGVEVGSILLRQAAARGATVAFLGGAGGTTEHAAAAWRARLPNLHVEVVGSGEPIGDDGRAPGPGRDAALVGAISSVEPAAVLVGLGAPKQERWIALHAADLPSVKVLIGVGGAFDMWGGRLRRAPGPLRRLGLEWAWRLALEPRRLPRTVRATVVFPFRALTDRST
jgi:N-acetylglucosaminyldiphosphoundecaprenol N-acetyl-beta-D-mannosaminyltransferase